MKQQYYIQQPPQSNIPLQQQQQQQQSQQPQVMLNNLKMSQQQGSMNMNTNAINLAGNPQAINLLNTNVGSMNPQLLQGRLMGQQNQNRAQIVTGGGVGFTGVGNGNDIGAYGINNALNSQIGMNMGGLSNNSNNSSNVGIPGGLVNHNAAVAAAAGVGMNIVQQPQLHNQVTAGNVINQAVISEPDLIKEVWKDNIYHEFNVIRKLVKQFKYISLSTEVPGIIARPIGKFQSVSDYHYQTMRVNSDITNLIQLSMTFSDINGKKPNNLNSNLPSTWQFNFKFDLTNEMFNNDTINDLKLTGVNFDKFEKNGIEYLEFAQLLIDSGLILNENHDIYWISFNCGYDFGFLSSLLLNTLMPDDSEEFLWWCNKFFTNFYDIKYISLHQSNLFSNNSPNNGHMLSNSSSNNTNSNGTRNTPEINFKRFNLDNLADNLGIPVQQSNYLQSGNQSLLTNICFFELKRLISLSTNNKDQNLNNYKNLIWGITKSSEPLFNTTNGNSNPNNTFVMPESHTNPNINVSTPLQHAINMGINVNSPMYLNR